MPATPDTVSSLRNVAIIAHVDHGKTSLVDQLLKQSGNFRAGELEKLAGGQHDLIMDSNPLERERGITILAKNCAVTYVAEDGRPYRINIIDTPGHADFGGEVERVLHMADGCLLVVDAYEGPMPQTRFVLGKALAAGLKPVVLVNKCDRPDGDPDRVVSEVLDLLIALGAEDDSILDFPVVYASARDGWSSNTWPATEKVDLRPVFEAIVKHVPHPDVYIEKPLRMQITTLDYSDYVGRIGVGRVYQGTIRVGEPIVVIKHQPDGSTTTARAKIVTLQGFSGLSKVDRNRIEAGDLCALSGIDDLDIGDTICDPDHPDPMDAVIVDEPTISMTFRINDSPLSGKDGQYVTSRQIRARLERELEHNVALRVAPGRGSDEFVVSGRGVLHLGILLETMRREGFELSIGRPIVIEREIDGVLCEPVEEVVVDCPEATVGSVMQLVGERKGNLRKMESRTDGIAHCVFEMTSRSLIGLRGRVLNATQGEAIMHHTFERFEPVSSERLRRINGVMIATEGGQVTHYACELLHERGVLFVRPGDQVYAGQVVGEHNRDTDIPVNICRLKHLSNVRNANKEATVTLKAPRELSLEQALEYIEDDELVELTPRVVRLRKAILDEGTRRRAERSARDRANS
ncbi:MAG: translational GTPase TypA [Phycisphaeraceae bacterium]|nr:translational GTPase TypA [Phycisphaeraceae bacterium]MCW5762196.1 translational GTPase TypA [Phycisphaeraceae bacterium]